MIQFNKIDLNRLYHFYYVVSCGSISQAALEVGIDQSGMSRQMQKLEAEVGATLLNRHREGISTTRKGQELFECTKRMFSELSAGNKQLGESGESKGKIRICSTSSIANYILAEPLLLKFSELYPDIEIELIGDDESVDMFKSNMDIFIRPYDSVTENIVQEPLFKLQAKLYASQSYIDKHGFPENEKDLSTHKFIARSQSEISPLFTRSTNWFLNIEGYTRESNCIQRTNLIESAFLSAENGNGIISCYDNMSILKKSTLINIAPNVSGPSYNIYFSYLKYLENFSRINLLKKYLTEYFSIKNEFSY